MLQQRQHILLSYFKTLSVGPTGLWTHDLSKWANQGAVILSRVQLVQEDTTVSEQKWKKTRQISQTAIGLQTICVLVYF